MEQVLEKKIFLIGLRKLHSEKKQQDFYQVDYAKLTKNGWKSQVDFVTIEEYNAIGKKGNQMDYNIGLFKENDFEKNVIYDIKATK